MAGGAVQIEFRSGLQVWQVRKRDIDVLTGSGLVRPREAASLGETGVFDFLREYGSPGSPR